MVARLVECTDNKVVYGVLIVEDVSVRKVQKKIDEIKKKFSEEDFDDWGIADVLEEFPSEWDWEFIDLDDNILEI